MIIKILGPGCTNCGRLEANAKKAVEELKIKATIEKVTDMEQIIEYGVMSTPALVVDEKVVTYGIIPAVEDIKDILTKKSQPEIKNNKPTGGCSCGGKC